MTLNEFIKEFQNILVKKGIKNPLYFVGNIISKIDNIPLSKILIEKDFEIKEELLNKLKKIIIEEYPVEYITKKVVFFNGEFYVDEHVLIPRIETEDLIKIAIDIIKENNYKTIIDIGTGSGVIAIILKKYFPNLIVYGIDISEDALKIANYNAKLHNVSIQFIKSDILKDITYDIIKDADFIISNPPYVETDFYFQNKALHFEPKIALEAGKDGQSFFLNLSYNYPDILKSKHFIFETTEFNIDKTKLLLSKFGKVKIYKDSFGINRFIEKLPWRD
ncbi:release factor glutamine methyltransferase [Marinitoga hydrogenitolerans DSM 16785]|uniref:peptide chain release factor N(5)-glutamine methyltransferase n=1 Tax=Marinitoga hydrogenitolerans (strain DSM 16785 / JCM 12826 / AT1271) TaxID=1122195 RepID=A0A1M4WK67_MARH1|nr:HemK/PrmC family methyltransferase [Marinitoga hydrogenitolerans]SHE81540.1 release factor glutamine methyltransferase [Marinitoga hydrogenitolerans DSM 16785]